MESQYCFLSISLSGMKQRVGSCNWKTYMETHVNTFKERISIFFFVLLCQCYAVLHKSLASIKTTFHTTKSSLLYSGSYHLQILMKYAFKPGM